jgi:ADP-dependent NAD(P)H-hydrate dehydratase / NAD(P)H-hydrate epimerase
MKHNAPEIWISHFPWPQPEGHKYDRGHTLVIGGAMAKAGAAKLAALAALRTGAGLVSIVCHAKDMHVYAASALSVMTLPRKEWKTSLKDARVNTVLIGPGAGVTKQTQDNVLVALKARKQAVLDADALTAFAATPKRLYAAIRSPCILTPHAGEFKRLFPAIAALERTEAARKAAELSHAAVVYKGAKTIIAAPDGRVCVNINAPPDLATAGSGDVLSGICAGLLAQGMDAFYAACAAVWLHGEAANLHGAGLIAEDIITLLPQVLQRLKKHGISAP